MCVSQLMVSERKQHRFGNTYAVAAAAVEQHFMITTNPPQTNQKTDGCRTDGPCNRKSEVQFNVRSHTFLHTCMHTSVVFIYIYLYVGKEFRPSVCLTLFYSSSSSPTFVMLDGWIVGWNEWLVHWLLFVAWLLPANVVVIVWLFFCYSSCRV